MPGRRAAAPARRSTIPTAVISGGGYDSIPGIEEVGAGDWIRFGLYAPSGWGKTSFAVTGAPAGLRTLIIRTGLDPLPARAVKSGAKQFIASTWEKMLEVQDFLRMANHGFDWVWWDCVSIAQDVLLDDVWNGTVAAAPRRAFVIGDDGRIKGPNLNPTSGLDRGEYGRNMERIGQWVRHMVGANTFHFGMTFHPIELPHPVNDQGGDLLQPWVQGKGMISKMCGYTNMLSFLEVKVNDKTDVKWRRFYFAENDRFYAKDMYDAFPQGYADNLTIPKLMAAVESARGVPLGGHHKTTQPAGRRGGRRREQ